MLGEKKEIKLGSTKGVRWYLWPLVPFVLFGSLIVIIPLGIFALIMIPYYAVYPDRHAHLYDFEATDHQRKRLEQWRGLYKELGFWKRLKRFWKVKQRNKSVKKQIDSNQ